jgi:hypothetical protein
LPRSYFYNQAEPLMTVVYWNVFFVALNALQLAFILKGRFRSRENARRESDVAIETT